NNIIKHAGAARVEVALTCTESDHSENGTRTGLLELRVHDDGRGFDPALGSADGLGLKIIRERAESIGASLQIDSVRDEGTTLVVRWERE
ncbi:MAG: sensor histidine kinase, partial [Anaerolineales bacterium]